MIEHNRRESTRTVWASQSGIPQRSVLDPILFVIYINDLPDITNSTTYLFADNTKINETRSVRDALLQDVIKILEKWSNKWLLKFHLDKMSCVNIRKTPKHCACTQDQNKLFLPRCTSPRTFDLNMHNLFGLLTSRDILTWPRMCSNKIDWRVQTS